mgnify:FL=1
MCMKFVLPALPYAYDSLEPFIDAKTMEIHHTKHHQTYVDKLNVALEKHPALLKKDVKGLLSDLNVVPEDISTAVRNHGGGHVNHSMFWEIMTPHAKERVFAGDIADALKNTFGSLDEFKSKFNEVALNRFGSGWAWLVLIPAGCVSPDGGKTFAQTAAPTLSILSTPNQDSPIMDGKIPLLGLDVWEHAYYLKHTSNRKAYVEAWWNVVNWKKVDALYRSAVAKK